MVYTDLMINIIVSIEDLRSFLGNRAIGPELPGKTLRICKEPRRVAPVLVPADTILAISSC
jgi:hypothetical protein